MEYHLHRLTYGEDLDLSSSSIMIKNQTIRPIDILHQEIRHFDRHASICASLLPQVEIHHLWASDPSAMSWSIALSILIKDTSIQWIREPHLHYFLDDLWIFTSSLVDDQIYGVANLFSIRDSLHSHIFVVRFINRHSNTQAELVTLRLGCRHALDLGHC